jgi:hypothetical protein
MNLARLLLAISLPLTAATAQFSLLTSFGGGMSLPGPNPVFYYDMDVATDVTITALASEMQAGQPGTTLRLWTTPTTWVGKENSSAGWTLAGTGTVVQAPVGSAHTEFVLSSPIPMLAGSYGLMFEYVGDGIEFDDGLFPLYRSLQTTAHLEIYEGAVASSPFSGLSGAPRVWLGRIDYDLGANVVTASATPVGVGCDGLTLGAVGLPTIGNSSFILQARGVPAISPIGFFAFGTSTSQPAVDLGALGMAGCFGYSDLSAGSYGPYSVVTGTCLMPLIIPSDPSLSGAFLSVQALTFSASTALGLASSNGLELTIGT